MLLPEALPKARGNAVADDERAALLGFQIFFDARFASDNETRCATCHAPERSFADGLATPRAGVPRNAPTIFNAARNGWQFWDGRADSLWSQPLFAFESRAEMDFGRIEIAQRIAKSYRAPYESVFGALPELERFPARGRPGEASYDALSAEDRAAIDRVAANVGKALEAYMRRVATGRAGFDRWLLGEGRAISTEAVRGVDAFVAARCATCHSGPTLSDDRFHVVVLGDEGDPGHAGGQAILAASVFRADGAFADVDDLPPLDYGEPLPHAFRTPSLRNVALTAPYFHDGRFATMEDAVRGHDGVTLSAAAMADVVAFLRSLDGEYPKPPWNNWPEK